MGQLTFVNFLKKYLRELSKDGVFNIPKLAEESMSNVRLIEPLVLFGIYAKENDAVLKALSETQVDELHLKYLRYYSPESFSLLVLTSPSVVPIEYRKVFTSYAYRQSQMERDKHTKRLIFDKVARLMEANHLAREQILEVVPIERWKASDWFVYGPDVLSLDEARIIFRSTEALIEQMKADAQKPAADFQLTVQ